MGDGTLLDLFASRLARSRGEVALWHRSEGTWRALTWEAWAARARRVAAGLAAAGVEPGDRVAIVAETSVEWALADVGILMAGAVTVPIYPSLPEDTVRHVLEDSGAKLVLARRGEVSGGGRAVPCLAVAEVERRGDGAPEAASRARAIGPDVEASVVYTSGTAGPPKGVLLTHRCFVAQVEALARAVALGPDDEQVLFLPLAHVLARTTLYLQMRVGYRTAFASDPTRVLSDCQERRPTFLVGVPSFYEKLERSVRRAVAEEGPIRGRLFDRALSVGARVAELRARGERPRRMLSLEHRIGDRIFFEPLRRRLGGRVRLLLSGAAPLDAGTKQLFDAAGLSLLEGYGLTETAGAVTLERPEGRRLGSVGQALPGLEVRVADDGEILVRGETVMRGYHGEPQATGSAVDADGWLHTGDLGRMDADGFLFVTDRKDEVLITASGRRIPPQRLEAELCRSEQVARAVVVGDEHGYPVALVSLAEERLREWARQEGISGDLRSLAAHPRVRQLVESVVQEVNARLPAYERIRRFAILPRELSAEAGELTPTGEVRRRVVRATWSELIASLR